MEEEHKINKDKFHVGALGRASLVNEFW